MQAKALKNEPLLKAALGHHDPSGVCVCVCVYVCVHARSVFFFCFTSSKVTSPLPPRSMGNCRRGAST